MPTEEEELMNNTHPRALYALFRPPHNLMCSLVLKKRTCFDKKAITVPKRHLKITSGVSCSATAAHVSFLEHSHCNVLCHYHSLHTDHD